VEDLRLSSQRRLRRQADFDRVYAGRNRSEDHFLLVYASRNDLGMTRFGLSVSRKHGGAVRRVRLKRLLREAFRLEQHVLAEGLDLVLIPQRGGEPTLEDLRDSLKQLVSRLAARIDGETAS